MHWPSVQMAHTSTPDTQIIPLSCGRGKMTKTSTTWNTCVLWACCEAIARRFSASPQSLTSSLAARRTRPWGCGSRTGTGFTLLCLWWLATQGPLSRSAFPQTWRWECWCTAEAWIVMCVSGGFQRMRKITSPPTRAHRIVLCLSSGDSQI